jgi:hypothetical protein
MLAILSRRMLLDPVFSGFLTIPITCSLGLTAACTTNPYEGKHAIPYVPFSKGTLVQVAGSLFHLTPPYVSVAHTTLDV